jgi:hypothetical protein
MVLRCNIENISYLFNNGMIIPDCLSITYPPPPNWDFNPIFIDPRSPLYAPTNSGNYSLTSMSPCQCLASITPVSVDFKNIPRPCPLPSFSDIGAFEICAESTPLIQIERHEKPIPNYSELNSLNLNITPNPSNGIFTVYYDFPDSLSNTQLIILNSQGVKAKEIKLTYKQYATALDLSMYPKGVYLIQMISNNGILTKKVVIE